MGLSKFRIGQLVEQTTEINTDYLFGADDVRGMRIVDRTSFCLSTEFPCVLLN